MEDRIRPILRAGTEHQEKGFIRFVCISDTHNLTEGMRLPPGDVLLHCGDFTMIASPEQVTHFDTFLGSLPYAYKIVIAGNHEITFDTEAFPAIRQRYDLNQVRDPAQVKALLKNCIYLEDSGVEIGGYTIWGSPWLPDFGACAFSRPMGEVERRWRLIPSSTDILMTHVPPQRILDTEKSTKSPWGCPNLLRRVKEINPIVHVFGHIHECHGVLPSASTLFINAAVCDYRYHPVNPATVFDLPVRSKS